MAGDPIPPADEDLLQQRFESAFPGATVNKVLTYLREHVPILAGLTMLQLREVMLESTIARFRKGDVVFKRGDYTNSLWNIAEGAAHVLINEARPDLAVLIGQSEFFGEIGLISGRRRGATVVAGEPSVMVEIPRRSMRRLQSSVKAIKAELDRVAMRRIVHTSLARDRPISDIEDVIAGAELKRYKAFETICAEGDAVDALYIMRTGSATVSRIEGGREVALNFIAAGSLFGERGLLEEGAKHGASIRATVASEAVRIDGDVIRNAVARMPEMRSIFEKAVQSALDQTVHSALTLRPSPPFSSARASARRPMPSSSMKGCARAVGTANRPAPRLMTASAASIATAANAPCRCCCRLPAATAKIRTAWPTARSMRSRAPRRARCSSTRTPASAAPIAPITAPMA